MYSTTHNAHLDRVEHVHEEQEIKPFKLCFNLIYSFINIRQKKLQHKSAVTKDVELSLKKDVYMYFVTEMA